MTLVGGMLCPDGFVLSVDSEITYGDLKIRGEKLWSYKSEGEKPFQMLMAGAGHQDYIDQFKDDLIREVSSRETLTQDECGQLVKDELRALYEDTILPLWPNPSPDRPSIHTIIGFGDRDGKCRLWKTKDLTVSEVATHAFVGSGETLGYHLAERLLSPGLPLSVAHLLMLQIIANGSNFGSGVGGAITTWSVRRGESTMPLDLTLKTQHPRYLLILEHFMGGAIRSALMGDEAKLKARLQKISETLEDIRQGRIFDENEKDGVVTTFVSGNEPSILYALSDFHKKV